MIDAGAIFKMSASQIIVGSDGVTFRPQWFFDSVLGTPFTSVFFTAYNDESLVVEYTNPLVTTPQRGNWGGIEIRNDVSRVNKVRMDHELNGVFLNYIAMADMRWGGGSVGQGTLARVVSPIHLNAARPTLLHNRIFPKRGCRDLGRSNEFRRDAIHREPLSIRRRIHTRL